MSDQMVANGRYFIHLGFRADALTALDPKTIVLVDDNDDGAKWDVAIDGEGSYTLRNVKTGIYLGSGADPTAPAPMLEGVSEPFAWKIAPGPEGTFFLSPGRSNGAMRLSTSPLRSYPPRVGWMATGYEPQDWRLVPVT
jgi:hypothetical protein